MNVTNKIVPAIAALVSLVSLSNASAAGQPDLFIGTLTLDRGRVILTRCDLAETRYTLRDAERGGPVSRFAAAGGRYSYGEVIGTVSEHDGRYALSVMAIDKMVVGKSCHLMDALNALERTPPPDVVPAVPDLAALVECRSDVATAHKIRHWLENEPHAAAATGIVRVPTTNFVGEYRLAKPITVWGHETRRLALHPDGLMAILDDVVPEKLAADHDVRQMLPPPDFLATKIIQDATRKVGKVTERTIISQSVSTRDGLPGKTIVGCIYVSSGLEDFAW